MGFSLVLVVLGKKAKQSQKDANAQSAYRDRVTKGVRFYDKKGSGHIKDGKKVYS